MPARTLSFARDVWRNRRGTPGLPRMLTYTVTFACNARCVMCDSWKLPRRDELTLEELQRIFAQLPVLDAVRLTGGEPLLRRDFPEIARLVQDHLQPRLLHVTSNGWLTERLVSFCEARWRRVPLYLLLSIDGMEEKHNQIRGSDRAWSRVMETIHALAPRQKELRLRMAVNQTIVDAEGVEHYPRLRELLQSYGVQHRTVVAYDTSATYNGDGELEVAPDAAGDFNSFGDLPPEQLAAFFDRVARDLRDVPWCDRLAGRYYLRGIRNRLLHGSGKPNPPCVALNAHLRMFPDGDVPTCQFNGRTIGNLRRQSFREVWQGRRAEAQRAWVRKCPGCWAECEVLPSAIYTLDLARSLVGIS